MNNELKTRIEQHKMWLLDNTKGERFVAKTGENFYNANLSSADLRSADLIYANLRSANLSSANLSSADLRSANLSSANLRSANLSSANLSSANLRSANLSSANLRSADLSSANLRSANLSSANLRSANLRSADLRSANLRSVDGFKFTPLQVVNTKYFITILDEHVLWGCKKLTFDEVKVFELKDCTTEWDKDEFKLNKKIITEMIKYYRKEVK